MHRKAEVVSGGPSLAPQPEHGSQDARTGEAVVTLVLLHGSLSALEVCAPVHKIGPLWFSARLFGL